MRTTVRLDDDLPRQAKALAARTGPTLTAVIADGLREALAPYRRRQERPPVALPTFKGKGLQPRVDLDDTVGFLDTLDDSRDASCRQRHRGSGRAGALESGSEWMTSDRDYRRFPGLLWRDPGA
jgi:hypothetical protein